MGMRLSRRGRWGDVVGGMLGWGLVVYRIECSMRDKRAEARIKGLYGEYSL